MMWPEDERTLWHGLYFSKIIQIKNLVYSLLFTFTPFFSYCIQKHLLSSFDYIKNISMHEIIFSLYMSACLISETVYQVAVKYGIWDPHSLKLLGKCNFCSEWSYIASTLYEAQITLCWLSQERPILQKICT
jgi:hypothetical protein